ncbi:hypothetical protein HOT75_gp146 [Gordonia phage Daredevil]|uniref:Uncharacterized protein n=1 Tax=Gordonia phage Daredevil TaxID=2283286 RepID=A0A345MJ01_9CAUD|nr:hypothetical protein HOT75_gp146 [Gordonia phage Daredevil]AXH70532.1 hypothetical protein SEA_DAREDEVIL_146 [Gordonia phage Daredevil]
MKTIKVTIYEQVETTCYVAVPDGFDDHDLDHRDLLLDAIEDQHEGVQTDVTDREIECEPAMARANILLDSLGGN